MTEVAWMLFLINSLPLFKSSAAKITTDVVPSPTSLSWIWDNSTRTLAAGWVTSNYLRIVAPSLVIVTSPISSTSILSRPWGPRDVFTMFERERTARMFWVLTSWPYSLWPRIPTYDILWNQVKIWNLNLFNIYTPKVFNQFKY